MKPEPVEINIEMPPGFAEACEALGIGPQEALQQFINHLSVYVHFTPPDNEPHSVVSTIFKAFDKQRPVPPPDAHRELHIRCIQQLLQLILGKMNLKKKEQQYHRLIGEWYEGLIKTEQL